MCITSQALVVFLNLISQDIVEIKSDTIIIHAETRDTIWYAAPDDRWCVERPLQFAKSSKD